MRAIYDKDASSYLLDSEIEIQDSNFIHLSKVCRVKESENCLVLNGLGTVLNATVIKLKKDSLFLKIIAKSEIDRNYQIDLLLGVPKKDYFEDCLRVATEIGIRNIIPFKCHYSQPLDLNFERCHRIFESALIQSNNPYLPNILPLCSLEQFNLKWSSYENVWVAFNDISMEIKATPISKELPQLLIIGPEGGFSSFEVNYFKNISKCRFISLPSPILKSSTAIAAIVGPLITWVK